MTTSGSIPCEKLGNYLQPGMKISASIQFGPQDSLTFSTTLVGFKATQFLLLDMPIKTYESLVMQKLSNVQIVIRGMTDTELGHIIAFRSSIYQVISTPFNLLFIRYPKHFASKAIREHERYKISLPVTLTEQNDHFEKSFSGTLVDFSVSGCGVFIDGENELQLNHAVSLSSALDSWLPQDLASHVVSLRRKDKGYLVGIKFSSMIEMTDDLRTQILNLSQHRIS